MKTLYYIPSCDTCRKAMKAIDLKGVHLRDIKAEPLTDEEVDRLAGKAGGYEAIFSKSARKYAQLGLKNKNLSESDYRGYILSDYTFLKRPLMEDGNDIRMGKDVAKEG